MSGAASESLPVLDTVAWRRALAGLVDDESPEQWQGDFREAGATLAYCLARWFNRDKLDVLTLWERIGTAIATACDQVDDGDLEKLVSIALETVKADHGRVASDEQAGLLRTIISREESWSLAFVRYLKTHSYSVLIHGRALWEDAKMSRREGGAA